jgi:hypothetical protein
LFGREKKVTEHAIGPREAGRVRSYTKGTNKKFGASLTTSIFSLLQEPFWHLPIKLRCHLFDVYFFKNSQNWIDFSSLFGFLIASFHDLIWMDSSRRSAYSRPASSVFGCWQFYHHLDIFMCWTWQRWHLFKLWPMDCGILNNKDIWTCRCLIQDLLELFCWTLWKKYPKFGCCIQTFVHTAVYQVYWIFTRFLWDVSLMAFIERTDVTRTPWRGLLEFTEGLEREMTSPSYFAYFAACFIILCFCSQRWLQLDSKKKIIVFKAMILCWWWRIVSVLSIFACGLAKIEAFVRAFLHRQSAGGRGTHDDPIRQLQVGAGYCSTPNAFLGKEQGKARSQGEIYHQPPAFFF